MGKLAKVVETPVTSISAMLETSGTDWDAQIVPAKLADSPVTGGFNALVRGDTRMPLAFVSERFRANSHRTQLAALEPLVGSGMITPASVSMWDNGAILAYQFRVPSLDIAVGGTDKVSSLLTLMFSYGTTIADMAFFAAMRAFCKNQMGKFSQLAGDDRVRHRGDVSNRYADILGRRISELTGEVQERAQLMGRMADKQLSAKALVDYVGASIGATAEECDMAYVTPPDELGGTASRIPDVIDCYRADDCGSEGSVWQAYNAVTRYTTHKYGKSDASRMRSVMMGQSAVINQRAWSLAAQLTA